MNSTEKLASANNSSISLSLATLSVICVKNPIGLRNALLTGIKALSKALA